MKVCLINPPDPVDEDALWDEPLGLLYLGAVLEEFDIDVEVVDFNFGGDLHEADVFGVYCSSPLFKNAVRISGYLKETYPDSLRIVGGPHATCLPESLTTHFDKIVVGEGERAIFTALRRDKQKIIYEPPIADLDDIPYPARHLVPINEYHRTVQGLRSTGLITSRGCPYSCAFCSKVWGKRTRFRSPGNILGEIEECIDRHGIKAFSIRDDTFTLHKKRLYEILSGFEELDIVWRCLTRTDQVNAEVLSRMSDAGCAQIVYGIESGNQGILDNLGKMTTVEQNVEAIRLTMDAGIETKCSVIIGSPGETWNTVHDTIHFIEDNPPDEMIVCLFTPYPGSPVWDDPEAFNMRILTRDFTKYAAVGPDMTGNVVVETEEMTADDIRRAHRMVLDRFRELQLVK